MQKVSKAKVSESAAVGSLFTNCSVPSSSPKLVITALATPYLMPPPKTETWKALLQSLFASRKSRPLHGASLLEKKQHPPPQTPVTTSGVCKTNQSPCPSRDVLCIHFPDHSILLPGTSSLPLQVCRTSLSPSSKEQIRGSGRMRSTSPKEEGKPAKKPKSGEAESYPTSAPVALIGVGAAPWRTFRMGRVEYQDTDWAGAGMLSPAVHVTGTRENVLPVPKNQYAPYCSEPCLIYRNIQVFIRTWRWER